MGSSMCGHVLDAGYSVTVYTRNRGARRAAHRRGARTWEDSPAEVAASSGRRALDRRLSLRRARGDPRRAGRADRRERRRRHRRHDDERARARRRDPRRSQGARGRRDRRARIRRRRRRPQRDAVVHGRRGRGADRRMQTRCSRRWGNRSYARAGRAPASTRRWSIRSSSPRAWSACARRCSTPIAQSSTSNAFSSPCPVAQPARGRSRTTPHGCLPATSRRASSSITS